MRIADSCPRPLLIEFPSVEDQLAGQFADIIENFEQDIQIPILLSLRLKSEFRILIKFLKI